MLRNIAYQSRPECAPQVSGHSKQGEHGSAAVGEPSGAYADGSGPHYAYGKSAYNTAHQGFSVIFFMFCIVLSMQRYITLWAGEKYKAICFYDCQGDFPADSPAGLGNGKENGPASVFQSRRHTKFHGGFENLTFRQFSITYQY